MICAPLWVYRPEIVLQCLPSDFSERSCKFNPFDSGTHDHESEPRAPCRWISDPLGDFKCIQNLVPDLGRFFYALQTGGPGAPGIVPVVRALRTSCDDQGVVFHVCSIGEQHALGLGIYVYHIAKENASVFLATQYSTQRRGNLTGRKRAGSDLIQQGLKR
jgi:hypothetical protein